ncbi:ankyrin repeat domain-containing protein [Leeuwenhoekiella sp. MAR_2009_132]|uniref:ankyrin repeat domain-containing protein n=1 Tax=Leeuwenhoekiella sp. MAR_2009_132 TaxID=1392489 RepID=UPI00048EB84F|nr:ankyrin repeat domain-containing protein [Leeuwenhoekiella sp. MAR_2009_132]
MINFRFFYFIIFLGILRISAQQKAGESALNPGFSVDIRFVDPLNFNKNSVVSGDSNSIFNTENLKETSKLKTTRKSQLNYEFVNSAYEFEKHILKVDTSARAYSSRFSSVYNANDALDKSDEFLVVFCLRQKPLYERRLLETTLSENFRDAVFRLGRDLTPQGFISKFGTHYAEHLTYGGTFISKNAIRRQDYIESPYSENEFRAAVLKSIAQQQQNSPITDPYIHLAPAQYYTIGGETAEAWDERWEQTVNTANAVVIDANLVALTNLLSTKNFPELENLQDKRFMLQEAIDAAIKKSVSWQAKERSSEFFKKYSLQFTQKIGKLIKQSVGTEEQDTKSYIGDLFFGSFNEHGEPMKTTALIDYNGLDLNTLLTDEEINVNKMLDFIISPEELKNAYVSVWDDTQKLVKGEKRTTLFVSGTTDAHTYFKEALVKPVYKEVTITTIDNDVFKVAYSLELVKTKKALQSFSTGYDYSLDSEVVAAAASGSMQDLEQLYFEGASRRTNGVVKALIQNFDDAYLLNQVFDFGVKPTTEDLDLAFDPDYFTKAKAIALLERGAKPKNNMIYKAVAYQEPEVVYALLREGATSVNNDVAFAAKLQNYKVIKALMSLDYNGFVAEENMLALAVANADKELTEKFIGYGAVSNPEILKLAIDTKNQEVLDLVKAVSKNSARVIEVVATSDNTQLFDYFITQGAVEITDEVLSTAIANNNLDILNKALDSGGSAEFALSQALKSKNTNAVRLSLSKGANANSVFEYAVRQKDFELFKDVLDTYEGDPQTGLNTAVALNELEFARYTFSKKGVVLDADSQMIQAVKNDNQELLALLISMGGKPQTALVEAVSVGNTALTQYLIEAGAIAQDASLIQKAVALGNEDLVRRLLETGQIDVNLVVLDLIKLQNPELVTMAIRQGVQVTQEALDLSIALENQPIVLQLLEQSNPDILEERFLINAIKSEKNVAVDYLIGQLDKPDLAFEAAFQYKNETALILALRRGALAHAEDLLKAANTHFNAAIPILIGQDLSVTVTDAEGNTVLHLIAATYEEDDEVLLDELFKAGVNVNAKNNLGETPLHWAVKGGVDNEIIITKLIRNGALPEAETVANKSVADYAASKEIRQLLKRLELR